MTISRVIVRVMREDGTFDRAVIDGADTVLLRRRRRTLFRRRPRLDIMLVNPGALTTVDPVAWEQPTAGMDNDEWIETINDALRISGTKRAA